MDLFVVVAYFKYLKKKSQNIKKGERFCYFVISLKTTIAQPSPSSSSSFVVVINTIIITAGGDVVGVVVVVLCTTTLE